MSSSIQTRSKSKGVLKQANISQLLKEQACGIGTSGACEEGSPYFQNWCTLDVTSSQCVFKSFDEIKTMLPDMMESIQKIARAGEILEQAKQQTIVLQSDIKQLKSQKEALEASAEKDKAVILANVQAETDQKVEELKEKWANVAEFYLEQELEVKGEIEELELKSRDLLNTYRNHQVTLTRELEELMERKANLERELALEQKNYFSVMKSNKEAKEKYTLQIRKLEQEVERLEQVLDEKQAAKDELESKLKSLKEKEVKQVDVVNKLDSEIGQKQGQSIHFSNQLADVQNKIKMEQQRLEAQKEQTRNEIATLQSEMNKLGLSEANVELKKAELAKKEQELANAQSNREALQLEINQSLQDLQQQQTALQQQKEQVAAQVAILNAELDQLRAEKQKLAVSLAEDLKSAGPAPLESLPIPHAGQKTGDLQPTEDVKHTWDVVKIPLILACISTLVYCLIINFQFTKQDPVTKETHTDWTRIGIATAIFVGTAVLIAIIQAILSKKQ